MSLRPLAPALVALSLSGCASVDVQCEMQVDYDSETPIAQQGSVRLNWQFDNGGRCKTTSYGCTFCTPGECTVYLKQSPNFHNVCAMAQLGHELEHALGARHD